MKKPTPKQRIAYDVVMSHNGNVSEAARELEESQPGVRTKYLAYKKWIDSQDPTTKEVMQLANSSIAPNSFWLKGEHYSAFFKPDAAGNASFEDTVRDSLQSLKDDLPITFPPRPKPTGENLLVVDLADVHIGKLCVQAETGYTYSREVARHRVIEGTRALLQKAILHGVARILFVLGNDILHIDSHDGRTTAGTNQDTEGSIDQMYSDAQSCLIEAIDLCAEVAPVDLLHCPSNHDWQTAWGLAQTIQAYYRNSPTVKASDYNVSKLHRKYYRYGQNLIGLSHGDGAKEADLPALMLVEARDHIAECPFSYWYLHHVHHKKRKNGLNDVQRLKEYTAMTVVNNGAGRIAGDKAEIEYVHSPSPPDGWHHRNGYINRQGVDCFLHSPDYGKFASFTEWF